MFRRPPLVLFYGNFEKTSWRLGERVWVFPSAVMLSSTGTKLKLKCVLLFVSVHSLYYSDLAVRNMQSVLCALPSLLSLTLSKYAFSVF